MVSVIERARKTVQDLFHFVPLEFVNLFLLLAAG